MLFSFISSSNTHFTVLDIKNAFFTIPLHPDSQDLFAFIWTNPDHYCSQQLIWTVLPQGFHDSPYFFGQAPASASLDLTLWLLSSNMWMISFVVLRLHTLNNYYTAPQFLASQGYLVSPTKVQFFLPRVTYLVALLSLTKRYINYW